MKVLEEPEPEWAADPAEALIREAHHRKRRRRLLIVAIAIVVSPSPSVEWSWPGRAADHRPPADDDGKASDGPSSTES